MSKKRKFVLSKDKMRFVVLKRIGGGGNGDVYNVKVVSGSADRPLVVKIFRYRKNQKSRYERFVNEAKKLEEFQTQISGLVKIIYYDMPKNPSESKPAWYLMEKYKSYDVKSMKSLKEKLLEMKQFANIISQLADKGYAHRDIKPQNILVDENGSLVLCDLGLLWHITGKRLTYQDEKVGPSNILPPELERIDLYSRVDYRCSDVYLFAKVMWMTIKKDDFGFLGQYRVSSPSVYLNPEDYDLQCIQPLHELFTKATHDDPSRRINIYQCISYINDQIDIIDETIHPEKLRKYQYDQKMITALYEATIDELVYSNKLEIMKTLKSLLEVSCFDFISKTRGMVASQIKFDIVRELVDGQIELEKSDSGLRYLVCIDKMVKSSKCSDLKLYLNDFIEVPEGYVKYGAKGIAASFAKKYFLDSSYHVVLKCRNDEVLIL